ncbi:MAG: hypothetical protein RL551_1161, partial [Pseudomonadota bacterium]
MGNQATAEGKFMRMLDHHKATHITQHHQDVLVN